VPDEDWTVQGKLDELLLSVSLAQSSQPTTSRDKAVRLAASSAFSGKWLGVIPGREVGTMLDNNSFRIASALRLGISFGEPFTCSKCGHHVDTVDSDHGLHCVSNGLAMRNRHDNLNHIISRCLTTVSIPHRLEPAHLLLFNDLRPDGVTLLRWQRGLSMLWDITVASTTAPSVVLASATRAGNAAMRAEARKVQRYLPLSQDYVVQPIAIETLGSLGPSTRQFFSDLRDRLQDLSDDPLAALKFEQRVSLELQRGNASCILSCMATRHSTSTFS